MYTQKVEKQTEGRKIEIKYQIKLNMFIHKIPTSYMIKVPLIGAKL